MANILQRQYEDHLRKVKDELEQSFKKIQLKKYEKSIAKKTKKKGEIYKRIMDIKRITEPIDEADGLRRGGAVKRFMGTKIYNSGSPWRYMSGGKIHQMKDMTQRQINNDSTLIVAMPNELIIPTQYKGFKKGELVNKVVSYLDKINVKLPNT
jgi:hypothetical protein